MKTAVDAVFVGKDRKFNRRFAQMCSHYLVEPTACTPAAGWEKGQVENRVGSLRQRLFIPRPHVKTLEELNRQLEDGCIAYARESRHPDDRERTVWEVFEAERPALVPIRGPFDGFPRSMSAPQRPVWSASIATATASRPRPPTGRSSCGAYADRVVVRFDGEVVATNERVFGRDRVRYNPLHYLPVLARKPGALRNGAPFKDCELPPKTPCPNVKEKRKAGTRAGLTKPAIAAAAKLIESIGPNGFSLRKLAKALGVGPILLLMFFLGSKMGASCAFVSAQNSSL